MTMTENDLIELDIEERSCILELLIQNAVKNNSQSSLKLLKSLSSLDPDGLRIYIDWDIEIGNVRQRLVNNGH